MENLHGNMYFIYVSGFQIFHLHVVPPFIPHYIIMVKGLHHLLDLYLELSLTVSGLQDGVQDSYHILQQLQGGGTYNVIQQLQGGGTYNVMWTIAHCKSE